MNPERLFIDTNYLVALLDPKDDLHSVAMAASRYAKNCRLLTTDFVIIEFLRLFAKRNYLHREAAVVTVKRLRDNPNVDIVPASRELFDQGLAMYLAFKDKQWDLVDCTSAYVMRKSGITQALTHDEHFVQMGYSALLREEAY